MGYIHNYIYIPSLWTVCPCFIEDLLKISTLATAFASVE